MAIQFSVAVRNAMLDAIETAVGAGAILKIRDGAAPVNCAAADSGTALVSITLAADWAANAGAGAKSWSGLPVSIAATATGQAAHFRLYASDGVTCHEQGTVTVTGGGGDLTVDNVNFNAGQLFSVTAWSWSAPNA